MRVNKEYVKFKCEPLLADPYQTTCELSIGITWSLEDSAIYNIQRTSI